MRKFEFKGKTVELSERAYKLLLSRFNPINIPAGTKGEHTIQKPCMCHLYRYYSGGPCNKCPLDTFRTHTSRTGCGELLRYIAPEFSKGTDLYGDSIIIYSHHDETRTAFSRIHEHLLSLSKY